MIDPGIDVGVPGGTALTGLVDAFYEGRDKDAARANVKTSLGDEAFVDAAAVFGNFEMMNRIAEGTGIPVPPQALEREAELVTVLGLDRILKPR